MLSYNAERNVSLGGCHVVGMHKVVAFSGLSSTYQQRAPDSGELAQTDANGDALYSTFYSESELLESSAKLEGAVYRVAIATSGFHARRAAVAATLVTWRQQEDSIHFINPYYGSMLARNASNYSPEDRGNQQYNFLPYAIVRSIFYLSGVFFKQA